jgi:hypothetical protein
MQPHGGWHAFTTIRLQGFSSRSLATVPRWWSSRRMTTSLVVGRSKPGCGLPHALSFKDVHHLCWGGGCAELGPRLCMGSGPILPSVFEGEGCSLFMRRRRTSGTRGWLTVGVASHRVSDALIWMASALPSASWVGARLPIHRTGDGHTVCRSATPTASLALPVILVGRTWRRTLRERRSCSRMSSLP